MPGRRNRRSNPASRRVDNLIRRIDKKQKLGNLSGHFKIATNAPYGFTVQGVLNAASAVFSSTVQINNGLTITSTTAALTVPRMTTTQRDALTAAVGMIIYNTTDSKFQGYAGSSWVNLH